MWSLWIETERQKWSTVQCTLLQNYIFGPKNQILYLTLLLYILFVCLHFSSVCLHFSCWFIFQLSVLFYLNYLFTFQLFVYISAICLHFSYLFTFQLFVCKLHYSCLFTFLQFIFFFNDDNSFLEFFFFGKYRLSSQCVLLHDLWVLKFNCSVADANLHRVSPSLKNWNCLHTPCDIFFMEHNGLRVSVNLHFLDATLCPFHCNQEQHTMYCPTIITIRLFGPFW